MSHKYFKWDVNARLDFPTNCFLPTFPHLRKQQHHSITYSSQKIWSSLFLSFSSQSTHICTQMHIHLTYQKILVIKPPKYRWSYVFVFVLLLFSYLPSHISTGSSLIRLAVITLKLVSYFYSPIPTSPSQPIPHKVARVIF